MNVSDSRLLLGLLSVLAHTPLMLLRTLGRGLGLLLFGVSFRRRRVCLRNLSVCFPKKNRFWRWWIACRSVMHEACTFLEMPYLWRRSLEQINARVVKKSGMGLLETCLLRRESVIFVTPHFGSWEMGGLYLSGQMKLYSMYRPLKSSVFEKFVKRGRQQVGATLVPADLAGIRELMKALDEGHAVGVLPDHVPRSKADGVLAPFFGVPANTSVLVSRLARRKNVTVLLALFRRCWGGYAFSLSEVDPRVYSEDREEAAIGINATVEKGIACSLAQYWWSYPRFRKRPMEPESLYSP